MVHIKNQCFQILTPSLEPMIAQLDEGKRGGLRLVGVEGRDRSV
jgi:hypothetical protein